MAIIVSTITNFPLNGADREFNITFDYLARRFVKVSIVGEGTRRELVLGVDYRFVTKTRVRTTIPIGSPWERIEIKRETSATDRVVNFSDGSILRAKDLNSSQIQAIHIAEESRDISTLSLPEDDFGNLDAKGRPIKNLGEPEEATDAVTKGYTDSLNSRAIRVSSPIEPLSGDIAGKVLSFDSLGNPIAIIPTVSSELALATLLRSNDGASIIGTTTGETVQGILNSHSDAIAESASDIAQLRSKVTINLNKFTDVYNNESLKVGDIVRTGRGVWEVLTSPVTSVKDLDLRITPSLYDFGATGGDGPSDSLAMYAALNLGLPCIIPVVPLSKAFVVNGIIDLPLTSSFIGDTVGVMRISSVAHDAIPQPFITFKDENCRFAGGRGAESRVQTKWSNIVFVSSAGIRPTKDNVKGMAIGPIDNLITSKSAIGGEMTNVSFYGFQRAFQNDWAYFFNMSSVDVISCHDGLIFDDWNSSGISKFYASSVSNAIDTGEDSASSTLRDIGININMWTEVAVKINAGVTMEGYNYFEGFGTVFDIKSTCLAYQSTYWSNRPMGISNVLFDASCAYHLTIDSTTTPQETIPSVFQVGGRISGVRFAKTPTVAKVGYGVHTTKGGNPTYPAIVITDFDIATCTGITAEELRAPANSPYKTVPCIPYMSARSIVEQDISSTEYVDLLLPTLTSANTNAINATVTNGSRWRVPSAGLYNCQVNLTLSNMTAAAIRACDLQLMASGTALDSSFVTIPTAGGGGVRGYTQVVLSFTRFLARGAIIYIQGRSGGSVYRYQINIQKISDGQ